MDKLDREALDPKWFNEYYEFFDLGTDIESQNIMMERMCPDYQDEVNFQKTMGEEDAYVDDQS